MSTNRRPGIAEPFHPGENGARVSVRGAWGRLEFPLIDPGSATPGEGIVWYDTPRANGAGWDYVLPIDVTDRPLRERD